MIEKNKVVMVSEVLDEFERICSSVNKMEQNELFEIAKRVQMLSGAVNVKIQYESPSHSGDIFESPSSGSQRLMKIQTYHRVMVRKRGKGRKGRERKLG
ncbi:hypothetical protein ACOSQ3_026198 [Xanthoceras sorbifolium]